VTTAAPLDVPTAVRRGVRLFNSGRYMSAHVMWEDTWREAGPPDRGFLEGLIQLAGGLHLRTRRGGTRGAVHLLSQAMVLLEDHRPAAHGVDVEALVTDFGAFIVWLKEVDRPHRLLDRLKLPRIRRT
jgi:predicted metal-dependent hydrolase